MQRLIQYATYISGQLQPFCREALIDGCKVARPCPLRKKTRDLVSPLIPLNLN